MPRRTAPFTDTKVKTVKPTEKPLKLFDGWGLYLLVTPTGGKLWNLKYRIDGKEKKLSLGAYPDISLAEARLKRDHARNLLANGVDPGDTKKAQKAAGVEETESFSPKFPIRTALCSFPLSHPAPRAKHLAPLPCPSILLSLYRFLY